MVTHTPAQRPRQGQSIELYEREYVPTVARPLAYCLLAAAPPRSHEQVLDVACGTGIVARTAAEAVGDVDNITGLDPSQPMLEVAASRAPAGMNWVLGSAEEIPLPDDSFTLALCLQGMQYFQDRHQALREIRRVLAPGGRFATLTPAALPPLLQAMAAALAEHVEPKAEGLLQRVADLGDPQLVSTLLEEASFDAVRTITATVTLALPQPLDSFDLYVAATPLAPMVAAIDDERREQLRLDFARRCAAIADPTSLPIDYVVGLGSKP